jgi:hypothetical protein
MKRIIRLMMTLAVALFATGCGKGHDERDARHDAGQLTHQAAADANHAVREAEQAANDLGHAVNAATVDGENNVRQAAAEFRDDSHARPDVIQTRRDSDADRPVDPAQLRQEVKRDAIDAAGAAAEEAAQKLLKMNR